MKIKVLLLTFFSILIGFIGKAQTPTRTDSLKGFSMKEMEHHLEHFTGTLQERNARIERSKRAFIQRKYKLGSYAPPKIIDGKLNGVQNVQSISCTNVDFEQGNTTGWTVTGSNYITSGAGLDPFGNFPVVFAGTHSLQLNDDNTSNSTFNTVATRILPVPATGVNFFKLSFAIDILDYPHDSAASAKFFINFFDASGNQLPCPSYECTYFQNGSGVSGTAGAGTSIGVSNFSNSACPGNCGTNIGGQTFAVTYAPWNTIALDLSPYNGTNVTCQVTCDWCIYQYDFGYAYIDAECPTSATPPGGNCGALPFSLCGPSGMDTYSWVPPSGNSPSTSNTSCINASVAGTYTLNATINTCSVTAYTFTYVVGAGPTAAFTDVMSGGCSGNGSFASTSTANGGAPISSYTWEWGDGSGNGSGANATHNFASSGTKTVTLVISNGGCVDSISHTVVVPPHPTVSFTYTNNCLNTVSNFVSTSTSSVAINTQNWNFGDGVHATGATQTHTYATAGNYSVTLAITDASSCTDSVTNIITIYPLPVITANSPAICGGIQTATLTAIGASTYTWSPAATLSSPTGNPVTGTPTVTTIYTITGTDVNGCVNTGTTSITISSNPTITATSSTICIGQQTATLTASGGVTYTWTPATLTPSTGSVVTGNPITTTQYTVTGSNAGGCVGMGTANITVNPLPTITVNSSTICLAQQIATLTAAGANTYTWNPSATLSSNIGNPVTGTPTTTTTYVVSGTDANGCINTANSTITVLPASVLTVNSATICVGEQVGVLTVNGAATYSWNPSATLSSSTAPTVTATPIATTGYTVTAVNPSGCVSTATSTVTVNPLPIITVNSSTICVGQQTATLAANGGATYTWTPATGLNTPIGSPVLGTPNTSTNYTVVSTDANGCINFAITGITVNVLPLPIVTSNTPCASQQALNLSCTPNGMSIYSWSGPNAYTSSLQNPSIPVANVTAALAGIYTVSVTDVNTCTNTATIDVSIHPLPVVTVNSPTVCQNQTINLVAGGGVGYSWSGPNGYTSGIPNPSIPNAIGNMSGSYVVTVTDANACVNANVAEVVVNPLPVISANVATICMGQQSATLTATGGSTYTWTPSNSLSGSFGSSVISTPNITTDYTVFGTDVNGCQSATTTTVSVYPLPVVSTSSVTPTCVPLNATFSVTSNPAASSYTWSFGNGSNSTSTLNPSSSAFITNTTYTAAGTYPINLSVTDIHGCVGSATTIAVGYPIPVADFNYGPQPVTILAPQVQFYNESVYAAQYVWNLGDPGSSNNIDSVVNPSHTYPGLDSATYYVTLMVTSINGCTASVVKPVKILDTYALYVPDAFTPNGDGKNEMFKAVGEGINSFKLYVFDRWGNNLFYSDDINKGWEGNYLGKGSQIVQEDVYVWKIDLVDFSNTQRSLHGTVTLLK